MVTGRGSAGKRLPLILAFGVLAAAAVGAGCRGFFVKATLTAVGITPATPTITDIAPNNTQQFAAIGTFNDGSTGSTSVTWSSDTTTVATVGTNSGLATGVGVGSTTITATSTILPTISGTTTLTVVPGNVTLIKVTPQNTQTKTGLTFELKAVDQANNDISGVVTWTFEVINTTTIETGMTQGTPDAGGMPFTVGTLSPTPAPVNLNAFATLTVGGNTVTSNLVEVDVTQ